jgi:cytochrome c-type biogenesis protein CcmH
MILFWLIGAALAAGVALLVLRPLVRSKAAARVSRRDVNVSIHRDQLRELDADLQAGKLAAPDYERARGELEARLLEDAVPDTTPSVAPNRAALWSMALAIPLGALILYFAVGHPAALSPQTEDHAMTEQQLEGMIQKLVARLRESPEDVEGWKLLGRSYSVLGRFPEAVRAYATAASLRPQDAELLVDFADVLAMDRGRSLQGEPERLVLRALELDPKSLKGLALAGTAAFERSDYAGAVRFWERMLPLVPAGSEDARSIRANVEEARARSGKPAAAAARALKGVVRLSSKLAAQAAPDDTVFIFARAPEGPPLPLAVRRAKVRDLPLEFSLDDSMAMAPGMNLSAHAKVVVGARVSKSGKPTASPGDLQGFSAPVANDASGVSVVIDAVVR